MPSRYVKNLGPALLFSSGSGSEEIGMIVALEIEVQLDIKGESEGFLIFTKIKLFLEEM